MLLALMLQSKQAAAVADEHAWSLLVRRKDGKDEHVDLEAASREERDRWVHAIQSLVATAKRTEMERGSKTRMVDVAYLVDQQGQVTVKIAPTATASTSASDTAPATAAPLTIATAAATGAAAGVTRLKTAKTEDDTPSPMPAAHATAGRATSAHPPSTAGIAITDATAAPTQRNATTSTTGLETATTASSSSSSSSASSASSASSSSQPQSSATEEKLSAALQENAMLKGRIAELEEMLKGSRVDSVPAS